MKLLIISILFFCTAKQAGAQTDMRSRVIKELQKISERYKSSPHIAFDVQYKYAAESSPGKFLDSLSGSFKMHGNEYWYRMDNTEAAGNGDMVVMLFKEDNVMYLAKPAAVNKSVNPLVMMDSMLASGRITSCDMTTANGHTKIKMEFRAGSSYKSLQYEIDERSGLLLKMTSVVQAAQLYDPSVYDKVSSDAYAVVEADFYHYRENGFDRNDFDLSKYFKKQGQEYISVAPYNSYKIFLGTPNL
jgi:hypothetical protein